MLGATAIEMRPGRERSFISRMESTLEPDGVREVEPRVRSAIPSSHFTLTSRRCQRSYSTFSTRLSGSATAVGILVALPKLVEA